MLSLNSFYVVRFRACDGLVLANLPGHEHPTLAFNPEIVEWVGHRQTAHFRQTTNYRTQPTLVVGRLSAPIYPPVKHVRETVALGMWSRVRQCRSVPRFLWLPSWSAGPVSQV